MITNQTNLKELSEEAIFDTNLENILLANQLVSEIHKNPNHIILTLTEAGVNALIKAIRLALLEEMRVKRIRFFRSRKSNHQKGGNGKT